jgi:hypothetical protein
MSLPEGLKTRLRNPKWACLGHFRKTKFNATERTPWSKILHTTIFPQYLGFAQIEFLAFIMEAPISR